MPKFSKLHPVKHTPAQMYALVSDVEQYPQFLPLCKSLEVTSRTKRGEKEIVIANMCVAYKALSERFTSRVILDESARTIDVEYLDGPFSYLHNQWRFHESSGGCEVDFHIDYEFKSRLFSTLVGGMFDILFKRFTRAFEERANEIYQKQL